MCAFPQVFALNAHKTACANEENHEQIVCRNRPECPFLPSPVRSQPQPGGNSPVRTACEIGFKKERFDSATANNNNPDGSANNMWLLLLITDQPVRCVKCLLPRRGEHYRAYLLRHTTTTTSAPPRLPGKVEMAFRTTPESLKVYRRSRRIGIREFRGLGLGLGFGVWVWGFGLVLLIFSL